MPHHQEVWFLESEPPTHLPEHAEGFNVQFPDVKQEDQRGDRCGKKPFGGDPSSRFCTWQYSFLPSSDSGLMGSTSHLQRISQSNTGKWQYNDSQFSPWEQPALPLPFSWLQSGCQSRPAVQSDLCSAFSFGCPRRAGKCIKPPHIALGTCPEHSQHPAYTEKQKQKLSADIHGYLWVYLKWLLMQVSNRLIQVTVRTPEGNRIHTSHSPTLYFIHGFAKLPPLCTCFVASSSLWNVNLT